MLEMKTFQVTVRSTELVDIRQKYSAINFLLLVNSALNLLVVILKQLSKQAIKA
jgi:hypothetical protein